MDEIYKTKKLIVKIRERGERYKEIVFFDTEIHIVWNKMIFVFLHYLNSGAVFVIYVIKIVKSIDKLRKLW